MSIDNIKFDEKGLVPAIVQDCKTGEVLMQAYMNRESIEKTLETGRSWFYSRSRSDLRVYSDGKGGILRLRRGQPASEG